MPKCTVWSTAVQLLRMMSKRSPIRLLSCRFPLNDDISSSLLREVTSTYALTTKHQEHVVEGLRQTGEFLSAFLHPNRWCRLLKKHVKTWWTTSKSHATRLSHALIPLIIRRLTIRELFHPLAIRNIFWKHQRQMSPRLPMAWGLHPRWLDHKIHHGFYKLIRFLLP